MHNVYGATLLHLRHRACSSVLTGETAKRHPTEQKSCIPVFVLFHDKRQTRDNRQSSCSLSFH